MKEVDVDKKRNIAVVGNHGSGKTSLIEAMLYYTGEINRLGKVGEGNTFADYLDEEKSRKITISSKVLFCDHKGYHFNLIDTPGYSDFVGDIRGAIHTADGVLVVINAASGVEVETEKIWEYLDETRHPRMVVINHLDHERADFANCIREMEEQLGAKVCPVRLPYGQGSDFKGVIDLVKDKLLLFDDKGGIAKEQDIPDEIHGETEEYRQKMVEAAVETNEELMERYLSDEKISEAEIRKALHDGEMSGDVIPVFAACATRCIGTEDLINGLIHYIPKPEELKTFHAVKKGSDEVFEEPIKHDGPGIGFVFKSMIDPFVGKIAYIHVVSGTLTGDVEWHNRTKGTKEKVGHLLSVNGKKLATIHHASVGDIVAMAKIESLDTNDTISTVPGDVLAAPPEYPQKPVYMAIHAKDKGDEDKVGSALTKIVSGDPTISVERDHETKEIVINAAGALQVELIAQKLKNQFKLEVELTTPKVAYRETITKNGEGKYRHKKQSGGRGQFGEVFMRLKPLERGQDYEFINNIFGGAIPGKFVPAVEKGIAEARTRGILAGYPVVDVSVELYDGSYHDVDSSEMAFKIASSMCFRSVAREKCNPVLLEPIMNVIITVPEEYMGDTMGDLNSRRGRVMGMDSKGKKQLIRAQVPLAEMYSYYIDLRSITHGQGFFEMEFSHYEYVPQDIIQKVVAESQLEEDEEG